MRVYSVIVLCILFVLIPLVQSFQLHHATGKQQPSDGVRNRIIRLPAAETTLPAPPTVTDEIDVQVQEARKDLEEKENSSEDSIFCAVASRAAVCLFESDLRRDAIGKAAGQLQASSATNWINDATAFALQKTCNRLEMKTNQKGVERDMASAWLRWMKSTPAPAVVDLSSDLQAVVNASMTDRSLELIDQSRDDFLRRLHCRLLLLPSGSELPTPLVEPPASLIFGKLLYGGVTRSRLLRSSAASSSSSRRRPPRRAGARTEIMQSSSSASSSQPPPAWMMYGGPDRLYEAVDMGPAAVLEVVLLPRGKTLESLGGGGEIMVLEGLSWKPQDMFDYDVDNRDSQQEETTTLDNNSNSGYTPASLSGVDRNEAFRSDFESSVGGLSSQIDAIVRRVLDGRVLRPAEVTSDEEAVDETTQQLSMAALEAEELALLGLTPVRGLLLYGPPGCGKTALAREISRALRARSPKIVSAPELLDRWVGGSEKLVRGLFAEAEAELAVNGGDATKSALHVIVIDEIDAVFRKRSSAEDSGEATRSSVVNQILAKLDGVAAIPNVLLIGMTNRRELLDEALLRPGRLEVQIEIPLPDKQGRREILQIHFDALRKKGRLSMPLCCAIDGVATGQTKYSDDRVVNGREDESIPNGGDSSSDQQDVSGRKRQAVKRAVGRVVQGLPSFRPFDLASATAGFSGADIAGLVRCAGSLALSRARKEGNGVEGLLITLEDAKQALIEVKR